MLDKVLAFSEIRSPIWGIVSDHESKSLDVAKKYGLPQYLLSEDSDEALSNAVLSIAESNGIEYIISVGYTRIFKGQLVEAYRGRLLNSHFSLLPAFPGRKSSDWTTTVHPARAIFERTLTYGARFTGNTIHLVDTSIDGGFPVIQSSLPIPYLEGDSSELRHRLFIQECQCLMQVILWLVEARLKINSQGRPYIDSARFDSPSFSPSLEHAWIAECGPQLAPDIE